MSNNIVKAIFKNNTITTILYEDRPAWLIHEVAKILGYKNVHNVAKKIRGDWKNDFYEGVEYLFLEGKKLNVFRELLEQGGDLTLPRSKSLILLRPLGIFSLSFKSKVECALEFRLYLQRDLLPKLVRERDVIADETVIAHKSSDFDIRKIELEERREGRLLLQAKMDERNQKASAIEETMGFLREEGYVNADIFAAYKVTVTEIRTGINLSLMRPEIKCGEWKTPMDIAEEAGFTLNRIGGVIYNIGNLRGNPKYSKTFFWTDPEDNCLHRCYMYNEEAVELIMSDLFGEQSLLA